MRHSKNERRRKPYRWRFHVAATLLLCLSIVDAGCFLKADPSPYYGRVVVPRAQEFRWSDGGLPQVFDPALAAAPPDTDAVRALFDGLTDYDPQTMKPVPAVASSWESSDEARVWTFHLRNDARWSTGEPVTAGDFVRSWERIVKMGDLAPHTELLSNIVGARRAMASSLATAPPAESSRLRPETTTRSTDEQGPGKSARDNIDRHFGAEAINDHTLRVHLLRSNPDFPALVAHPVFRPAKTTDEEARNKTAPPHVISNGAFLLAKNNKDSVLLERADNYWDKAQVNLARVEFVDTRDAESALSAYRAGTVDAVTNAPFEPLALKLLAPYADYRRATFGALTYYTFNTAHRPFDDVRVREALAIAVDRERISKDELGGATEPAGKFLPEEMSQGRDEIVVAKSTMLDKDLERAKELLKEAGYPAGEGFPTIRLLINRNEQQKQVAQAIAAMWRNALNIETDIIIKNWDDYEAAIRAGDYDLVRRGVVMQSTDELTNLAMLFPAEAHGMQPAEKQPRPASTRTEREANKSSGATANSATSSPAYSSPIDSEVEALRQLRGIPIYFASSSALVKPYVSGFDTNILAAPSLKRIHIDTSWQEPKASNALSFR
jgi:oligopeptide transport system substrate-binding protein